MKEVIPLAVKTITETIPNIYKRAMCNSKIITLGDDVSNELNIGDKIQILHEYMATNSKDCQQYHS